MEQKGLCRALLLILFVTCAVAKRAQDVLRSDSLTGMDAGKVNLEVKPSASDVTPEKVGARLGLSDTSVVDMARWIPVFVMHYPNHGRPCSRPVGVVLAVGHPCAT